MSSQFFDLHGFKKVESQYWLLMIKKIPTEKYLSRYHYIAQYFTSNMQNWLIVVVFVSKHRYSTCTEGVITEHLSSH